MASNFDCFPGTEERVLLMSGTLSNISAANRAILEELSKLAGIFYSTFYSPRGVLLVGREKQVKILIPQRSTGKVIGQSGDNIRRMRSVSGCKIHISDRWDYENHIELCVTVLGDIEKNVIACSMILEKIAPDTNVDFYLNVNYSLGNFPLPTIFPMLRARAVMENNVVGAEFCTNYASGPPITTCGVSPFICSPNDFSEILCEFLNNLLQRFFNEMVICQVRSSLTFVYNHDALNILFSILGRRSDPARRDANCHPIAVSASHGVSPGDFGEILCELQHNLEERFYNEGVVYHVLTALTLLYRHDTLDALIAILNSRSDPARRNTNA